jgi:hypothetical protein
LKKKKKMKRSHPLDRYGGWYGHPMAEKIKKKKKNYSRILALEGG